MSSSLKSSSSSSSISSSEEDPFFCKGYSNQFIKRTSTILLSTQLVLKSFLVFTFLTNMTSNGILFDISVCSSANPLRLILRIS
uniref:Uncharacterized protein n=1 Tax=Babesia bovis TaxID=5865 RepID=S6BL76_BABBO|nr:hypothetical protein [Babesia bovis]